MTTCSFPVDFLRLTPGTGGGKRNTALLIPSGTVSLILDEQPYILTYIWQKQQQRKYVIYKIVYNTEKPVCWLDSLHLNSFYTGLRMKASYITNLLAGINKSY